MDKKKRLALSNSLHLALLRNKLVNYGVNNLLCNSVSCSGVAATCLVSSFVATSHSAKSNSSDEKNFLHNF